MSNSSSFSMRETAFAASKGVHSEVDSHPFVKQLFSRSTPISAQKLRDYIHGQALYLGAIEEGLASRKLELQGTQAGRGLYDFFQMIFRADSCKETVKHLDQVYNTQRSPASKAVSDYIAHIQQLTDVRLLCVHAWINMTDALFGGAMIARRLDELFDGQTGSFMRCPKVLDPTLGGGDAMKQARVIMARQFQPHFDGLGWTEGDVDAVVAEAKTAFLSVKKIFDDLLK
ncbi:MAG: biliverdin-producing heme oxygenase [Chlamydiia bacterium]|nr:biliverdin-producing heme oxygenase [Chlamydiia bacterium]